MTEAVVRQEKAALLMKILQDDTCPTADADLRRLALSPYGFVNDDLRRKIWPKVLGIDVKQKMRQLGFDDLMKHRDYEQVVLDVNRSLRRFPPALPEEQRLVLQDKLTALIMRILVNNPDLHYYQGFHDICVTFLLVLGKDLSFRVIDILSRNYLRDFMDADMMRTRNMLAYLFPIIEKADPALKIFMDRSEVGNIFCLSWLITWYGHVLDDARQTVRLYDVFLSTHPLMPIYLAAAIVLHRREEILATECEMCQVHVLLSHIPNDLPLEPLIIRANELFNLYPPIQLAQQAKLEYNRSNTLSSFDQLRKSSITSSASSLSSEVVSSTIEPHGIMFKMTVWSLTAAMGALILAMQYAVRDMW